MTEPIYIPDEKNREVVVSVANLCKSFDGVVVLKDLNLHLYKGENLVVLGKSGSGKSVLIKNMAGLLKPDSGTVTVLGKDITGLQGKELQAFRLKIGFSFQDGALYDSMTVRNNIAFALVRDKRGLNSKAVDDAVRKVLDDVQLAGSIDKFPAELSGGQIKRVGIARALVLQPEIMLYDEPTAGLDPATSTEINKMIDQVQQTYKTSSIIITHDLTCAKTTGNRVAVLSEGRIIKEGDFKVVFASDNPLIRSFYDYNFTH
jgi:phospholipid/cholesterol/gamma-HCH transport system ATP-binding protein